MKNYYAILEVPVGASLEEIRQAYRRLVQEHLDDEAVFADLKEAYEVLSTPTRRAEYDGAVWGGAFDAHSSLAAPGAPGGRCPMGAEAQCPVLQGRATLAETYCPDCGFALAGLSSGKAFEAEPDLARPWLEGQAGETYPLHVGINTVGRDSADVLVADKTVSRLHARLELSERGSLTVEDLGSTNGTQVSDMALMPNAPRSLADGDRLRFGSISVNVHLPLVAAPAKAPGAAAFDAPAEALALGAQLVGIGEGDERTFLLKPGMTTFGRRPENTVVLSGDLYVSGSHAQISAEGGDFILTDIGSTNGTLLNSVRLQIHAPVQLSDGDEILIGGTALRFERLKQSAADPVPEAASEPEAETTSEQSAPEQNATEQNATEHAEG